MGEAWQGRAGRGTVPSAHTHIHSPSTFPLDRACCLPQAKRLKIVETELQQMGSHVAHLHEMKTIAVRDEDYDT